MERWQMSEPDQVRYPHLWLGWASEKLNDMQCTLDKMRSDYKYRLYHPDDEAAMIAHGQRLARDIQYMRQRIARIRRKLGYE